ncbi:MAG: hypothetical protein AVDCRST_MAG93-4744 [uncultured Chloroflexia bacterium]|uniref:Uncharacterized protein n=1 Tax=uncultured Chloroflexia bacterium TaxID=1672391 RepID=A0A6J4KF20_9CHLR|nr:MAG: hypothetical protein AVDCRST_MAG93-4744 [uncultured Chloroflexia bacterium]
MPRTLYSRLEALEATHTPEYSGAYTSARERLEAKLLSTPYDGPELSPEESARLVAALQAELRADIAERKARGQ